MSYENILFYDLETNGLDFDTTGIMQLTLLDKNGNILLNEYVYPFDNRIACSEIHGIDESKLINNNAITTMNVLNKMKNVIRQRFNNNIYNRGNKIYLAAYNNFGYDQNILENNFKICNIDMPENWYFVDLFPIIKEFFPDMKPNHKLKTVYENLFGVNDQLQFHCALTDTKCLYEIYNLMKDAKYLLEKYTRPGIRREEYFLTGINTLTAYNRFMKLESNNIYTVGDLYEIYKNCEYDNARFENYLRNSIGIYSNFFINNAKKQVDIIKKLQC